MLVCVLCHVIRYVEDRALIVEVEEGSLADKVTTRWPYRLSHYEVILVQNGVERGDVLDELCGDPVLAYTHGRVNPVFAVTAFTVSTLNS